MSGSLLMRLRLGLASMLALHHHDHDARLDRETAQIHRTGRGSANPGHVADLGGWLSWHRQGEASSRRT
jgi:hypothetical protein